MRPRIPGSIKEEYDDLYEKLNAAARVGGEVGEAAMLAFLSLQNHYLRDQEFALPPLKLLPTVAQDNVNREIDQIQTMCNRLKDRLPQMLRDIEVIERELEAMADVAEKEEKPEYQDLARRLVQFLEREKHILYPASMLVGEFVRLDTDLKGLRLAGAARRL